MGNGSSGDDRDDIDASDVSDVMSVNEKKEVVTAFIRQVRFFGKSIFARKTLNPTDMNRGDGR